MRTSSCNLQIATRRLYYLKDDTPQSSTGGMRRFKGSYFKAHQELFRGPSGIVLIIVKNYFKVGQELFRGLSGIISRIIRKNLKDHQGLFQGLSGINPMMFIGSISE